MKEIFLGKPTEKQLEWMKAHAPVTPAGPGTGEPAEPEEPIDDEPKQESETQVVFTDGRAWTGTLPLDRQGCEGAFCDADMEDAGVFEGGERGDVVSIRVQDGATALGGPFGDDYASLSALTLPASVEEIWSGAFEGGSLQSLVFLGKTQAEAEELADPQYTMLPEGCVIEGELG